MRTGKYFFSGSFYQLKIFRKIVYLPLILIVIYSCQYISRYSGQPVTSEPYWNELAQFLAGMEVSKKSTFWPLTQSKTYKKHAKFLDDFWVRVRKETIDIIIPWRIANIPIKYKRNTVFYPLSGADFINMFTLFPDSPNYLMIALEEPGNVIQPNKLSKKGLINGLASIRRVIYNYGMLNYFQSRIMKREMENICITGVTPVLLIFIARMGLTILKVENVGINSKGGISMLSPNGLIDGKKPATSGICIYFSQSKNRRPRELIYLSMRLGKDTVDAKNPNGIFLNNLKNVNTILKSAVYLLHMNDFKEVKDFVIKKSVLIIQDDSGVPYNDLIKSSWDIKLFGVYKPFHVTGCYHIVQKKLMSDYRGNRQPLPFNFGYGSLLGKNKSNLMIAIKKIKIE